MGESSNLCTIVHTMELRWFGWFPIHGTSMGLPYESGMDSANPEKYSLIPSKRWNEGLSSQDLKRRISWGFPARHGDSPSSLDGLVQGKSIYKWMLTRGTPMTLETSSSMFGDEICWGCSEHVAQRVVTHRCGGKVTFSNLSVTGEEGRRWGGPIFPMLSNSGSNLRASRIFYTWYPSRTWLISCL